MASKTQPFSQPNNLAKTPKESYKDLAKGGSSHPGDPCICAVAPCWWRKKGFLSSQQGQLYSEAGFPVAIKKTPSYSSRVGQG